MLFKTIMMFSILLTFLKTLVQLKSIRGDNVLDIPFYVCVLGVLENVIDVGRVLVDVQVP
jgi:hypothetical protein